MVFVVEVILFPLNLVLRVSLTFFGTESKRGPRTMFILLLLTWYGNMTYRFSDGCWLIQSFTRIFPIERLHPTNKTWLVLIICLVIIINYYHLVSLHEENRDHYLLGACKWLCMCICKTSIRSLGLFHYSRLFAEAVWQYMFLCQSTPSCSLVF